jgi:hypothetical protein
MLERLPTSGAGRYVQSGSALDEGCPKCKKVTIVKQMNRAAPILDGKRYFMKLGYSIVAGMLAALLLETCGPQITDDITRIDLLNRNLERLRSGVERLAGDDSVGRVAMDYVSNYEESLVLARRTQIDKIKTGPDRYYDESGLMWVGPPAVALKQLLTTALSKALHLMRERYTTFQAELNAGDAKMCLATGYVAMASGPNPAEFHEIVAVMDSTRIYLQQNLPEK